MTDKQNVSIGEQVVTGTLWMGSWRWSARLIGFFATIILARLLVPEDFGILAPGAIIIGFFSIFVGLGTESYLIRHESPDRDDYDTAWTLRLIVNSVATVGVLILAQPGADYFGDQRIVDVVRAIAIAGWLAGFANIGFTMYRRELQYRIVATVGISQRIIASVITVVLAFWLKNYWALVIGEIVFMLLGLVLSYTHHSYRPRFTLKRAHQQWNFSQWIVVQNIATFLQGYGDSFIVTRYFGIELMGLYTMASRFAAFPTRQVMAPVLSPIFSGLAKKQGDPENLCSSTLKVIGATAALILPAATLLASLSEELITLLLGERWLLVIPLVVPLTLSIMLAVLTNPAGTVLTVKGRVKQLAGLSWLSAISVIVALLIAAQWGEIALLVWARVGVTLVFLVIYYSYMLAVTGISLSRLIGNLYRPVVATLAMAWVINQLSLVFVTDWMVLISGSLFGGLSYLLFSALLWKVSGSPDSGEALVVRKVKRVIARRLGK